MTDIQERGYAQPEALVSTAWLADHLEDSSIRILESNEDPLLYRSGHIPNAIEVDWVSDLNDPLRRDYIGRQGFETLAGKLGITPETKLIFYGDKSNWWACFSLWVFEMFGHRNAAILDGGRKKWEMEGRTLTRDVPSFPKTEYQLRETYTAELRAYRQDVLDSLSSRSQLVDVRSPEEFAGTRLHMPDYPNEGALRGGHIPGAKNVPWAKATNPESGEFLDAASLRALYLEETGLDANTPTIAYCRIGERSSHTWFVLQKLLGFRDVRNYDGSWTEWGNSVGLPIER